VRVFVWVPPPKILPDQNLLAAALQTGQPDWLGIMALRIHVWSVE
jgi:hypothetical protein